MSAFVGLVLLVAVIGVTVSAADLRDRRRPQVPLNRQRLERLHRVECTRNAADRAMP